MLLKNNLQNKSQYIYRALDKENNILDIKVENLEVKSL